MLKTQGYEWASTCSRRTILPLKTHSTMPLPNFNSRSGCPSSQRKPAPPGKVKCGLWVLQMATALLKCDKFKSDKGKYGTYPVNMLTANLSRVMNSLAWGRQKWQTWPAEHVRSSSLVAVLFANPPPPAAGANLPKLQRLRAQESLAPDCHWTRSTLSAKPNFSPSQR